tara:strand:- start:179 stop:745 length:567 start_codon:yes stop_codon:yes gene_type:complete
MSRRVGLARIESLIENLKRNLTLTNTTLTSATLKGCSITGDSDIQGTGITGLNRSDETTLTRTGAGIMGAMEVSIPAGALIIDAGVVISENIAIGGSSTVAVRVGTGADGQQICAAANLISSATAETAGTVMNVIGAKGEASASLAFVAQAPMWSSSARTIHITMRNADAENTTGGKAYAFVRFMVIA